MADQVTSADINTVEQEANRPLTMTTAQPFGSSNSSGYLQKDEADAKKSESKKTVEAEIGVQPESLDRDASQTHGVVIENADKKYKAGIAQIKIEHVIPITGQRKPTTKIEYWLWVIYVSDLAGCFLFCVTISNDTSRILTYLQYIGGQGVGVGNYGAAIQQSLVNEQFPSGYLNWGGRRTTVNSYNLDLNGILFAAQLACLLILGPYADYGNWRPILLIGQYILSELMST